MKKISIFLLAGLTILLSACGFHLRNSQELPFHTIYIGLPESNEFRAILARNIRAASSTEVVSNRDEAEAIFLITLDQPAKVILSLNASGRVREYQLRRQFNFRVQDKKGRDLMVPASIQIHRDISFSDDLVLSKESEEALLWRDIQNDLVQQVLRRLAAAKRKPLESDEVN